MKKSGRLSLCFDVLELAVSAIPEKKRPEVLGQVFDPEFRKSQLYKALPSEADNRLAILIELCLQAKSVLEQEKDHNNLDGQLITDIEVQPNVVSDVALLKARRANIEATGAKDLYVDGGFHSAKAADEGENLSIHYTNMSGTRPTKKMDAMEFGFDDEKHIIQCPAGSSPVRNHVGNGRPALILNLINAKPAR